MQGLLVASSGWREGLWIVVAPPGGAILSPWWGLDVAGCVLVVFWRAHTTNTTHLVSRSLYNTGAHGGSQRL